jgi:putative membrane protein
MQENNNRLSQPGKVMEPVRDPRLYMAAERTFLAWIRTGIALMGFGFIVARFGLFLRELVIGGAVLPQRGSALSIPIGMALIAVGIATLIFSALHHRSYIRALDRDQFRAAFDSRFAFLVAGLLALIGIAMTLYIGGLNAVPTAS